MRGSDILVLRGNSGPVSPAWGGADPSRAASDLVTPGGVT